MIYTIWRMGKFSDGLQEIVGEFTELKLAKEFIDWQAQYNAESFAVTEAGKREIIYPTD